MDVVLQSFFDRFKRDYGFERAKESEAFEKFVIYNVASLWVKSETVTADMLENLNIGDGNDWGIDGIIVLVNGRIVTTPEEVDDILAISSEISVRLAFIQAKCSPSISAVALGCTLDGVEWVFKGLNGDVALPVSNESLDAYRRLIGHIYTKSAQFQGYVNPSVDVYFSACGQYQPNADYDSRIEKFKKGLEGTNFVSKIECRIFDRDAIITAYKSVNAKIEREIKVEQKIALPEIQDVNEAYLCLIPFAEFRKLIIDENGDLMREVFYDNIRDFQGHNIVNVSIRKSLRSGNLPLFTAMNNGLTVIAKRITQTGLKMRLEDYQIVNGCQTCNVLQGNLDVEGIDELVLPVKIISTKNKFVQDSVIIGNNSQTEVHREQLIALSEVQKRIEDYFNAQKRYERLYYERRSKQYSSMSSSIPQSKIVTIPMQIMAFVSMIMGKPHQVRGYYGSIVENLAKDNNNVFAEDTSPALYYTSALAYVKMYEMFSAKVLPRKYKKVKFHLLLALRLLVECKKLGSFKVGDDYCDHICGLLCDGERCKEAFKGAASIIDHALGRDPIDQDRSDKAFTASIKRIVSSLPSSGKRK